MAAAYGGADAALCSEGLNALLFYVDTNGVDVKLRESSDSGATLGAAVTVVTAASAVTWLAADVKSNGEALLLYSIGATVYAVKRSVGYWGSSCATPRARRPPTSSGWPWAGCEGGAEAGALLDKHPFAAIIGETAQLFDYGRTSAADHLRQAPGR